MADIRFNSKMVRFKGLSSNQKSGSALCFNSKMVRFKVIDYQAVKNLVFCFNSKMVRFKERALKEVAGAAEKFQFQNGAI